MTDRRVVCISTFFGSENYGSNLQAIGLKRTLENMGYDVYMLGKVSVFSYLLQHPTLIYARLINKANSKVRNDFFVPVPYQKSKIRMNRLEQFNNDHYSVKDITNSKEWKAVIDNKTIFVSGADIIWNPTNGYPTKYFLDYAYFAKLPRFSFGSSIGANELPKQYFGAYKRYLGSMVEVGVREQSVANTLEQIIGRKVTKVVDPSLLLTSKDWDEFASKAEISVPVSKEGYVLCYFVMNDQRYWDYIKKVKEATGKQIIVLPMHELDEKQPYDIVLDGTLYEFLWLIKNAEFICTDSFHACVVSLIYQKEFYLLRRTRKAEDAKYDDFLSRYHLLSRSVLDESQFERNCIIDYSYSTITLQQDRDASLAFLKSTLEKC